VPWARFADDYLGNPKLARLSTAAIALDMASIIYSARDLRDGYLTDHDVRAIAALLHLRRWEPATDELVVVHRWVVVPGGWEIHDYLDYQPSRAKVLAERAAAAQRKRRIPAGVPPDSAGSSPGVRPESGDPVPGPGPVPGNPYGIPSGVLTPNPFPAEGAETGAGPPSPRPGPGRRANGTNPRSTVANPRATGTNPRARGSNPRARRGLEFNEDGPRYEQRVGADGKREWVEVEA